MRAPEAALGPPILAWLQAECWDCYQEVAGDRGCADIVATSGPLVAVVELKVSLSFELLWQARRWRTSAHQVYVGVPYARASDGRHEAEHVFHQNGIGVLTVQSDRVTVTREPEFFRRADVARLRAALHPEQKTFLAAGTSGGSRWTPYQATCKALRGFVREKPGATIGEAVAGISHHYASSAGARARLVDLIGRGVIEGLRVERVGRKKTPCLYPAEAP